MKRVIIAGFMLSMALCGCVARRDINAQSQLFVPEIFPSRFLVLEVTPQGEPQGGKQCLLMRLAPHYGKISRKSLDFRLEHETQELSLVTYVDAGYSISTNEIIGLRAYQHLKFSPGTTITRHKGSNKTSGGDVP